MLVPSVQFRKEHFGGIAYRAVTEQHYRLNESAFALLELAAQAARDCHARAAWEEAASDLELAEAIRTLAQGGLLEEEDGLGRIPPPGLRGTGSWTAGPWLSAPIIFEVYPIFHCNERCRFCYVGHQVANPPTPPMKRDRIEPLVRNLADAGVFNVTVLGGEPFLYPHLAELLCALGDQGFDIAMSTNGTVKSDELLAIIRRYAIKLNMAIHADTPELHDTLVQRPGAFCAAVATAQAAVAAGIPMNMTAVLTPANVDRAEYIVEFAAKELGVRAVTLNYSQASDFCTGNSMTIAFDAFAAAYRGALVRGERLGIHVTLSSHYSFLIAEAERRYNPENPLSKFMYGDKAGRWALEMQPNGDMYPSYEFFGRSDWLVGNAFTDELGTIWASAPCLRRIRSRQLPEFCRSCEHRVVCGGGLLSRPTLRGELEYPPRDCPIVQSQAHDVPGPPSDRALQILSRPQSPVNTRSLGR